jgi:hypothetical protein
MARSDCEKGYAQTRKYIGRLHLIAYEPFRIENGIAVVPV